MTHSLRALPLLVLASCAGDPAETEAPTAAAVTLSSVGGVGPGFLFGGAAGTVASQRQDLIAARVPASLASRSSFDGTDGNVDSPGHIQDIVDRVACDAQSGITANIALHAPGQGAAQDFQAWGSDQAWIDALSALAAKLKAIKQPIYIRYGKEFNQDWTPPNTCIDWLANARDAHAKKGAHWSCADELFWEWAQVRKAFAAAPNVQLVWCPTGQLDVTDATRHPAAASADELWPGAGQVDIIGPDAYNGKRSDNAAPATAFGDFVALAAAADKPFLISETGIVKGYAKGAAFVDDTWYTDLFHYLVGVEADGVDVLGVAGFWRATDFGDTTLRAAEGDQLADAPGFLRAQPQRAQGCVAE